MHFVFTLKYSQTKFVKKFNCLLHSPTTKFHLCNTTELCRMCDYFTT